MRVVMLVVLVRGGACLRLLFLLELAIVAIQGGHELRQGKKTAPLPGEVPVRQELVRRHPPGRSLCRCAALEAWESGLSCLGVGARQEVVGRREWAQLLVGRIVADQTLSAKDFNAHGQQRRAWEQKLGKFDEIRCETDVVLFQKRVGWIPVVQIHAFDDLW